MIIGRGSGRNDRSIRRTAGDKAGVGRNELCIGDDACKTSHLRCSRGGGIGTLCFRVDGRGQGIGVHLIKLGWKWKCEAVDEK